MVTHEYNCCCSACNVLGTREHPDPPTPPANAPVIPPYPRCFYLYRIVDKTGISGTGHVADGVVWPDGSVAMRWRGPNGTTVIHRSMETVMALHVDGHGRGNNELKWLDEQPEPPNAFGESCKLTRQLHEACKDGAADSPQAEALREKLDGLWGRLSKDERQWLADYSETLHVCAEARRKKEST